MCCWCLGANMMSITCYSMWLLRRYLGVGDLMHVSWGYRKCYVHNPPGDYFKVPTKGCNQVPQIQIVLGDGTNHKEDKAIGSAYASLEVGKVSSQSLPVSFGPTNSKYKVSVLSMKTELAKGPSSNWIFSMHSNTAAPELTGFLSYKVAPGSLDKCLPVTKKGRWDTRTCKDSTS